MYIRRPIAYICPVTKQIMSKTTYDRLRAHVATADRAEQLNAAIRLIQRRRTEGNLTAAELHSLLDFAVKERMPKIV